MKENLIEMEENINTNNKIKLIDDNNHKSFIPDKKEKYDIYIPLEKDDDDDEDEDSITITKKNNYNEIMSSLKKDIFSYMTQNEIFNNYPYLRVENTTKYIPQLSGTSKILTEKKLIEIHSHLPYYHQYKNFKLLYSMDVDGTNVQTIIDKCSGYENTILIAKSDKYEIFGAYLSESLRVLYNDFYGTAETFIFTFFDTDRIRVFPATRENENYIYTDEDKIAFGCTGENFGLSFEKNFAHCFTGKTTTYNNPPLVKEKVNNILVVNCELWTFNV